MWRCSCTCAALPLLLACDGDNGGSRDFQSVPGVTSANDPDAACGDPLAGPYVSTCDAITQQRCQDWGRSLVRSGIVYTSCVPGAEDGLCYAGDQCAIRRGNTYCLCGGNPCPGTPLEGGVTVRDVCVSDPPGTRARCVHACK